MVSGVPVHRLVIEQHTWREDDDDELLEISQRGNPPAPREAHDIMRSRWLVLIGATSAVYGSGPVRLPALTKR